MRSTTKVVAVDLDEVLGEFIPQLAKFHNSYYPDAPHLTAASFFSYHFADVWGGTKEESIVKVHQFFASEYFKDIPVVPGAKAGIQALLDAGYRLVIVTSRQLVIEDATRDWVNRHFPDCFDSIAFGNEWGLQGKKATKRDMCQELGADCLVDDSVGYAIECGNAGINVLLFGEYAWNRNDDATKPLPAKVQRVANWQQVIEVLINARSG